MKLDQEIVRLAEDEDWKPVRTILVLPKDKIHLKIPLNLIN